MMPSASLSLSPPCRWPLTRRRRLIVGIVVVRDSNHYGIAGYYAKMAADQGLLGISMTNTEALVVPTFGKQPMMGTNPIAVSMPGTPHPFHLDMATSVVPAGKMEVYAKAGKTLPGDWLMNSDGSPSYDPNDFPAHPRYEVPLAAFSLSAARARRTVATRATA